jgi:flagellar biosynthesis/type III secretory pathway protein FliH
MKIQKFTLEDFGLGHHIEREIHDEPIGESEGSQNTEVTSAEGSSPEQGLEFKDTEFAVKVYKEDEVEVIKKQSYDEGYSKAKAEAELESQEKHKLLMQNVEKLQGSFADFKSYIDNSLDEFATNYTEMIIALLEKLKLNYDDKFCHSLYNQLKDSLVKMKKDLKVVIKLPKKTFEVIGQNLKDFISKEGFSEVSITADENMTALTAEINWGDGGFKFDYAEILDKIETLFKNSIE